MNNEDFLKGLLYRANYRGCKETDILIGKFAKAKLDSFNDEKLGLFDHFLKEDDAEIYDWILNKIPCPDQYQNLVNSIKEFHDL